MGEKEDKLLVENVREAAKKTLEIGNVEKFVGQAAAINTIRLMDRVAFEMVSIEIDRKESQLDSLSDVKNVVYWVRPISSNNPKIVGVAWTAKNEMKVFFGIVLPP